MSFKRNRGITEKNEVMSKALVAIAALLAALFSALLAAAAAGTAPQEITPAANADEPSLSMKGSIAISLNYGGNSGMDDNNDGIESASSAVDFTVSATSFLWPVNETNLCTLWRVLPLQSESVMLACNGAAACCNFAGLVPYGEGWNDTFYLYRGIFGVTDAALVSAELVYADYKISDEEAYSDIAYSDWETLTALFTSAEEPAPDMQAEAPQAGAFTPLEAFSGTEGATITVNSPANSSALASGEGLILSVTANNNNSITYSLDNSANATMDGNTSAAQSNYTATLPGGLPQGVIANGAHTLALYSFANATPNITARLEHPFTVQDNLFPSITTAPVINNTAASSLNSSYAVSIASDEYANISYALNSGAASQAANAAKSANITLTPVSGSNNLTITATDMQGNSHSYTYRFNFSINGSGTCQDATQNYHDSANETGVDCGGPCQACVAFAVSTDKDSYATGEMVYVSVQARADAQHNITITGQSYMVSFAYNGSTYYILSPQSAGQYKINVSLAYRNLSSEYTIKYFTVNSTSVSQTFSVSVLANATAINANDTVEFKPQVTGNASPVSYKWDLNGDNITDGTSPSVNYTYTSAGSFAVNLTANDNTSTKTALMTITVRPFYNITVNVKSSMNETVAAATVTISGETKAAAPTAYYLLLPKDYDISINASGYKNKTARVSISQNETFAFTLHRHDTAPPAITLLKPDNNFIASSPNITLTFKAEDETRLSCTILTSKAGEGWGTAYELQVKDASAQQVNLSGIENATYSWRIECADEEKHAATSESRNFTVRAEQDFMAEGQEEEVNKLIEEINKAIAGIGSYDKLEKEAAETLMLASSLEKSKIELQRLIRDIKNVKWRKFNSSEEEAFLREKADRIRSIESNLTTGVSVIKAAAFVSYPTENNVKEAVNTYLASAGKELTRKELERYAKDNKGLQQSSVVTTKYKIVELQDINGGKKTITLLEKTLELSGNSSGISDSMLIETVPKELAGSAKDIVFLFEHEVIKDDPVVSVKLPEDKKFAYYFAREFTQPQIQTTTSVMLKKEIGSVNTKGSKAGNRLTGFTVFSNSSLLGRPGARLAAEAIIALALAAVYVLYSKRGRSESKQLKHASKLVQQIKASLSQQQDSYETSKKLYAEASEAFKQLNPRERKSLYSTISELRHGVDAQYATKLIGEATALLAQGKRQEAQKTYERITAVYKLLPAVNKKGIYEGCSALHKKLDGAGK